MIIVYGSIVFSRTYDRALAATCGLCGKRTTFHLTRDQTWVTFFLIPLFPAHSDFALFCDGCKNGTKLYDGNGRRVLRMRKHTRMLLQGAMTEEEYDALLAKRKLRLEELVPQKPPDFWKCPVCKTINPLRSYKCSYCGYWN